MPPTLNCHAKRAVIPGHPHTRAAASAKRRAEASPPCGRRSKRAQTLAREERARKCAEAAAKTEAEACRQRQHARNREERARKTEALRLRRQRTVLLEQRQALIRNKPPEFAIAECRRAGCVGVGYVDGRSPTAMCFLCTEQWAVDRGVLSRLWSLAQRLCPTLKLEDCGVKGSRPCPHCGVTILKNGGCSEMFCPLCRRYFHRGAMCNVY